jgi:heat shock protein 5
VVANDSGDRLTPAVVAFTDREVLVGAAAKQQLTRNAPNSVANVKRLLGVYYSKEVVPEGPLQVLTCPKFLDIRVESN